MNGLTGHPLAGLTNLFRRLDSFPEISTDQNVCTTRQWHTKKVKALAETVAIPMLSGEA
jgi:hypothetical protein